jgi:hypothetical protein
VEEAGGDVSLLSLRQIQEASLTEIEELVNFLNSRGKIFMKVFLVLDAQGKPVEAFAYPDHAMHYINSTLTPGLTVEERTIWWSYLKPRSPEHDAGGSSMPQS